MSPPAWSMPHSIRKETPLETIVVSFDAGHVIRVFDAEGDVGELVVVLV